MWGVVLILISLVAVEALIPARAADSQSLCETAAAEAERRHALPDKLLQAISIVETGRDFKGKNAAWPWTVNIDGRGHYFKSKKEAHAFAKERATLGVGSMDIGCFQINTRWHGKSFSTIDTMFDPETTADYAASFLKSLYSEFGDWDTAVKKYHSRTKTKGERYGRKISAVMESITAQPSGPELFAPRFSPIPLTRLQPGGVELVMFSSSGPIVDDTGMRPLFPAENPPWN
ncbi:MAG: transglycosylase SLT domain-containing protein [Pseudomonadota bacterium]